MANMQTENLSAILEYPFDFERYMEEQLREIDELDERIFAKKVLIEGMRYIIRQTEKKYQELERRVYQEISIPDNAYNIVSTIVKRAHFDPTNDTLYPVIPLDLSEEKTREALSTEEFIYIDTVFLKADRQTCQQFESTEGFTTKAAGKEKEIPVHIRRTERYRSLLEQLYYMFQDNHIPWETVNIGYLDKFYDVYVLRKDIAGDEAILEEFVVDYGTYKELIQEDILPLWNIQQITFDSMNFMVPCIDGAYYEHELLIEEKNWADGYLVQMNQDISEIRHEKGKIIIKSGKETFENWTAVRIVQKKTIRSLDYDEPLLTNRRQDSFIRRYANGSGTSLLTKSELFRKIMELDIRDYIEIVGYEILENGEACPAGESMNWFVREELFPMEGRKVLLLSFREKDKENYLNDSMIWFVVSQIQSQISEYRCVGIATREERI